MYNFITQCMAKSQHVSSVHARAHRTWVRRSCMEVAYYRMCFFFAVVVVLIETWALITCHHIYIHIESCLVLLQVVTIYNNYNSEAVYTALNTFLKQSSLLVKKTGFGCWDLWVVRNNI